MPVLNLHNFIIIFILVYTIEGEGASNFERQCTLYSMQYVELRCERAFLESKITIKYATLSLAISLADVIKFC